MEEILLRLGFSKKQSQVYVALLRLGETTITDLAREAHLKRPTTYLVVEELVMLGVVSQAKRGKNKFISPVHPRRVYQIAQLRAKIAEEKLPELVALYNAPTSKPKIRVFEGDEGLKTFYKEIFDDLHSEKEALWFARVDAINKFPKLAQEFERNVAKIKNLKIRELNYENKEAKERYELTKPKFGTKLAMRFIPKEFQLGLTDGVILGKKVAFFSLSDEAFVTLIESEEISKTFRAIFNFAWENAKKEI